MPFEETFYFINANTCNSYSFAPVQTLYCNSDVILKTNSITYNSKNIPRVFFLLLCFISRLIITSFELSCLIALVNVCVVVLAWHAYFTVMSFDRWLLLLCSQSAEHTSSVFSDFHFLFVQPYQELVTRSR